MPVYRMSILRAGLPVADESLRAITTDQAINQLQLRLARCPPGDTIVLSLNGVEQRRLGPRRSRP